MSTATTTTGGELTREQLLDYVKKQKLKIKKLEAEIVTLKASPFPEPIPSTSDPTTACINDETLLIEIESLSSQLNDKNVEVYRLTKRIQSLEESLIEVSTMKDHEKELEFQVHSLNLLIESLNIKAIAYDDESKKCRVMEEKLVASESKLREIMIEFERSRDESSASAETLGLLNQRIRDMDNELNASKMIHATSIDHIKVLETSLIQAHAAEASYMQQVEDMKHQTSYIYELQVQVKQLAASSSGMDGLQPIISQLEQSNAQLVEDKIAQQQQILTLTSSLEASNAENTKLMDEVDGMMAMKEKIASLGADYDACRAQLDMIQHQLSEKTQVYDMMSKEKESLAISLSDAQQQHAAIIAQHDVHLINASDKHHHIIEELSKLQQVHEASITSHQHDTHRLEEQVHKTVAATESLTSSIIDLEQQLAHEQEKYHIISAELKQSQEQYTSLLAEHQAIIASSTSAASMIPPAPVIEPVSSTAIMSSPHQSSNSTEASTPLSSKKSKKKSKTGKSASTSANQSATQSPSLMPMIAPATFEAAMLNPRASSPAQSHTPDLLDMDTMVKFHEAVDASNDRIKELERDIIRYQTQLHEHQASYTSKDYELTSLRHEYDTLKQHHHDVNDELMQLKDAKMLLEKRLEENSIALASMTDHHMMSEQRAAQAKLEIQSLSDNISVLMKQKEDMMLEISKIMTQLQDKEALIYDATAVQQHMTVQASELTRHLSDAHHRVEVADARINELETMMQHAADHHQQVIISLQQEIQAITSHASLTASSSDLDAEIDRLQVGLVASQHEMQALRDTHHRQEHEAKHRIDTLEAEIQASSAIMHDREASYQQASSRYVELEVSYKQDKMRYDEMILELNQKLTSVADESSSKIHDMTMQLQSMTATRDELEATVHQLSKSHEETIRSLTSSKSLEDATVHDMRMQLKSMTAAKKELEAKIQHLSSSHAEAIQALTSSSKSDDMMLQLDAVTAARDEAEAMIQQLTSSHAEAMQALSSTDRQKDAAINDMTMQLESMIAARVEAEAKIHLSTSNAEAILVLTSSNQHKDVIIQDMIQREAVLQKQVDDMYMEREVLSHQLHELQSNIISTSSSSPDELHHLQQQVTQHQQDKDDMLVKHREEVDALGEKLKRLKQLLSRTKNALQDREAEVLSLKQDLDKNIAAATIKHPHLIKPILCLSSTSPTSIILSSSSTSSAVEYKLHDDTWILIADADVDDESSSSSRKWIRYHELQALLSQGSSSLSCAIPSSIEQHYHDHHIEQQAQYHAQSHDLRNELAELQASFNAYKTRAQTALKRLGGDDHKRQVDEQAYQQQIQALEAQVHDLQHSSQQLQEKIDELHSSYEMLTNRYQALADDHASLQQQHHVCEDEKIRLQLHVHDLEAQHIIHVEQIASLSASNSKIEPSSASASSPAKHHLVDSIDDDILSMHMHVSADERANMMAASAGDGDVNSYPPSTPMRTPSTKNIHNSMNVTPTATPQHDSDNNLSNSNMRSNSKLVLLKQADAEIRQAMASLRDENGRLNAEIIDLKSLIGANIEKLSNQADIIGDLEASLIREREFNASGRHINHDYLVNILKKFFLSSDASERSKLVSVICAILHLRHDESEPIVERWTVKKGPLVRGGGGIVGWLMNTNMNADQQQMNQQMNARAVEPETIHRPAPPPQQSPR